MQLGSANLAKGIKGVSVLQDRGISHHSPVGLALTPCDRAAEAGSGWDRQCVEHFGWPTQTALEKSASAWQARGEVVRTVVVLDKGTTRIWCRAIRGRVGLVRYTEKMLRLGMEAQCSNGAWASNVCRSKKS